MRPCGHTPGRSALAGPCGILLLLRLLCEAQCGEPLPCTAAFSRPSGWLARPVPLIQALHPEEALLWERCAPRRDPTEVNQLLQAGLQPGVPDRKLPASDSRLEGLLFAHTEDELFCACPARIEKGAVEHAVVIHRHGQNDDGVLTPLAFMDRHGIGKLELPPPSRREFP